MTDAEFWRSTPYLTRLFVEAAAERERRAYGRVMFAAWYAGAFFRVRRMPPLRKVMRPFEGRGAPARRMSPEEMLAIVEGWNAANGGRDLRKAAPAPVGDRAN